MSDVFVVRNQLGHYWGKAQAWEDGTEPKAVMRFKHEDEAINTLFELSSKDIELRGEILTVELSSKGEPVVEPSEHLLPKKPKEKDLTAPDQTEQDAADAESAATEADASVQNETRETTDSASGDDVENTAALES